MLTGCKALQIFAVEYMELYPDATYTIMVRCVKWGRGNFTFTLNSMWFTAVSTYNGPPVGDVCCHNICFNFTSTDPADTLWEQHFLRQVFRTPYRKQSCISQLTNFCKHHCAQTNNLHHLNKNIKQVQG